MLKLLKSACLGAVMPAIAVMAVVLALLSTAGVATAAPREAVKEGKAGKAGLAATPTTAATAATGLAAAMAAPAPPGEPPRTITMRFHDVALHEVFDILSRQWRVNILLNKGITGRVTVNLFDVDITQAVQAVAQAAGYAVEMRKGDYVILERADLGRDVAGSNSTLRTYKVQYSNVKQVAEILGKYVSRMGKITMLAERNLLVVEDAVDFQERIERLLATIDVEPRQILIEAKILEITLDSTEAYGVDWSRIFGTGGTDSIGTRKLATPGASGFFFNLVNQNLNIFLSALSSNGRVRTLSTPKLLALENQEARAVIGEQIGYRVTTTTNQITTESIQFLDTGVILKVTPSVDQRGRVLMSIHPEVSSGTVTGGIPSKKSTEVTTQLLCEDGQAVFIGGLIKRVSGNRNSGVPGLKNIPGLGVAFSNNEDSGLSTETVVVITPRIVKNAHELAALAAATELDSAPPAAGAAPAKLPAAAATPAALPVVTPVVAPVPAPVPAPVVEPVVASVGARPRAQPSEGFATDDPAAEDERAWFTRMARQLKRVER